MPTIKINERDLSWYYRQREPGQLVVLMPGVSIWGPVFDADKNQYPILLNEENFSKVLGDNSVHFNADFSYHMAQSYIKAGIDVYFLRLNPGFEDEDTAKLELPKVGKRAKSTIKMTTQAKNAGPADTILVQSSESEGDHRVNFTITVDSEWGAEKGVQMDKLYAVLSADSRVTQYYKLSHEEGSDTIIAIEKAGLGTSVGLKCLPGTDAQVVFDNTETQVIVHDTTGLIFSAKYPGSMGGRLSVRTWGVGNIRNVKVYLDHNLLVEDIIYDFDDVYSPYYYEIVNRSTQYVEVTFDPDQGGFDKDGPNLKDYSDLYFSSDLPVGKTYDELTYEELKEMKSKMYLHDEVHKVEGGSVVYDDQGRAIFDRNRVVTALKNALSDPDNHKPTPLYEDLKDPLIYNYSVIVDGGYNDCEDTMGYVSDVDKYFASLAKERMDTIYLVSGHEDMSPENFFTYCGLPSDTDNVFSFTFDSSFVAAFGPWCYSKLLSNGSTRCLPGYYSFLVAWGQSMSNGNPIWLAPAGIKRASLGDIVKDTKYFVGSGVVDMWQNQEYVTDNAGNSRPGAWKVNPICKLKQYGFVVYGNSTLLKNYHNGATSMLQSFSTRVMVNLIKTRAFDICLNLQFDQTSKQLFGEFKTLMGTFLDQLRRSDALWDYKIIADISELTLDDLNSHRVPIKIMISPTPTAENFVINLEISKAGITFSDETPAALEYLAE